MAPGLGILKLMVLPRAHICPGLPDSLSPVLISRTTVEGAKALSCEGGTVMICIFYMRLREVWPPSWGHTAEPRLEPAKLHYLPGAGSHFPGGGALPLAIYSQLPGCQMGRPLTSAGENWAKDPSSLTEPPGWSWRESQQGLEGGAEPGGLLRGGGQVWVPVP